MSPKAVHRMSALPVVASAAELYATTGAEDVREWIELVKTAYAEPEQSLLRPWERDFVRTVVSQYEQAERRGVYQPFSGMQLVYLTRIYERAARLSRSKLARRAP